jgi:hypothetical protein
MRKLFGMSALLIALGLAAPTMAEAAAPMCQGMAMSARSQPGRQAHKGGCGCCKGMSMTKVQTARHR